MPDATANLALLTETARTAAAAAQRVEEGGEHAVVGFFDEFRDGLLRYAQSLGLSVHDGEDVIQDTFLALFRHLELGRPRHNLRGWIFRVTHNLALKQRYSRKFPGDVEFDGALAESHPDPAANPEEQLARSERRARLLSVLRALPAQDRQCLCLRAEGLRYREIADVLGMSLGAVANSLSRSFGRLGCANER